VKTLLISMPFASATRPALGISLLKAELLRAGQPCDVVYANIAFARLLGIAGYERIATGLPHPLLAGEWVFTDSLYRQGVTPVSGYQEELLERHASLTAEDVELVLAARALAPAFIDECLAAVPWLEYGLVGFTSGSAQNLASLALASRLKQENPHLRVVFGGSNWDEEMGRELHERFPFVDCVCSGEADRTLPALVRALAAGKDDAAGDIPGLVLRRHGRTHSTGAPVPVADLDGLPYPDYVDYFETLHANKLVRALAPSALVETCRGCWWASRHPCSFCGSPGCRREYRTKSPERILREMRAIVALYPCASIELVDDVPSPEFFDQVLPVFAAEPLGVPLFCESRPGISEAHVGVLAAAGASIQPGIESLSDHVLRLMRKGSRALENVRLLRWCRSHGVRASWNLIYGVPGETVEDYEEILRLLPSLRCLDPPDGCGPVRLDRFSSYAEKSREPGVEDLEALDSYRYLYPFPDSSLRRIAYAFEWPMEHRREVATRARQLLAEVRRWQEGPIEDIPVLRQDPGQSPKLVWRRGPGADGGRRLSILEGAVLDAARDICPESVLQRIAGGIESEESLDQVITTLRAEGLLLEQDGRYLSLVATGQELDPPAD